MQLLKLIWCLTWEVDRHRDYLRSPLCEQRHLLSVVNRGDGPGPRAGIRENHPGQQLGSESSTTARSSGNIGGRGNLYVIPFRATTSTSTTPCSKGCTGETRPRSGTSWNRRPALMNPPPGPPEQAPCSPAAPLQLARRAPRKRRLSHQASASSSRTEHLLPRLCTDSTPARSRCSVNNTPHYPPPPAAVSARGESITERQRAWERGLSPLSKQGAPGTRA